MTLWQQDIRSRLKWFVGKSNNHCSKLSRYVKVSMNHRYIQLHTFFVIVLSIVASGIFTTSAVSLPELGGHVQSSTVAASRAFRLEIPSVNIDLPVITAHFAAGTWDFSHIFYQAGYFEGTPLPGIGGNLVIGAHSEFANRVPGPFYHLSDIQVGAQITIVYHGQSYVYQVTNTWAVDPSDVSPIYNSSGDTLTLMTCSGYDDGVYRTRLIVRAVRVS